MQASDIAASGAAAYSKPRLEAVSPRHGEKVIRWLLAACAAISVITTTAIVISLLVPSIRVLRGGFAGDFFFGTDFGPDV